MVFACFEYRYRANPLVPGAARYDPSKATMLVTPTTNPPQSVEHRSSAGARDSQQALPLEEASVGLLDLTDRTYRNDLFAGIDPSSAKLMALRDQASRKFGRDTIGFAASGW